MLRGIVEIRKNGVLVERRSNAISAGLRTYFVEEMNSPTDRALDDLFSTMGQDGNQATGEDGIIIDLAGENRQSTETEYSGGGQWVGTFTNTSGSSKSVEWFFLGHNFQTSHSFETSYASFELSTPLTLEDQDSVVITWQLTFEAA
jgi:hypothetical protein